MNKDQFAYLNMENNDLREMHAADQEIKRELVGALKEIGLQLQRGSPTLAIQKTAREAIARALARASAK